MDLVGAAYDDRLSDLQPLEHLDAALALRAEGALRAVGLGHRLEHRPSQLSGGEQQRVAIARALVGEPRLLLADEPTGNLDTGSGAEVMRLLSDLVRDRGVAVVVVTHDHEVAALADRRVHVRDGLLETSAP